MDQHPEPPTSGPEPPQTEPDRLKAEPHRPKAEPDPAKRRRKRTQRIAVIAGTAALTTAVSGIVGGVVSPDRVESVLGLSDDASESATESASESASESTSPSADEPEVEYKRVTDSSEAIAVDVPASWRVIDDGFTGIDGVTSPGLALRAGPDPSAFRIQSDETAYVGASTQALDDLGLVGLDDAQVTAALVHRRQSATYLSEYDCVPTNEHTPRLGDAWVGAAQVWEDCFQVQGWRAIEIEMVSAGRDAYVFIQIGLPASTPDEVSQRLVDSLTVLSARLPTG